ncbi:sensor histidine kinase [Luethyella okanaganae]|uniref:histidine kinase n=1 Tax=Luethyella okanaganae TaxID=69372 RepID=A0ABW1VFV1_9MICO
MTTESATTDPDTREQEASTIVTTVTEHVAPARRRGYGSLWVRVPQELGFLLLGLPMAVVSLSVLSAVFFTGVGTIALVVGFLVLVAALYLARGFGAFELERLRWAGRPAITPPQWEPPDRAVGFVRGVLGPFVNGHCWLYLLHGMVVAPVISVLSWTVTVVWLSIGTSWTWMLFLPNRGDREFWPHQVVLDFLFPGDTWGIDPILGENVFQLLVGLLFLVTLPFITRVFTMLHYGVAKGMLATWRSEALTQEVADLSASRGAALIAEDQSLRRLERDIHDGPQQRLVRLQMDLASAERKLDSDPDAAKTMLAEAREQARDTLEELRALSRGFAPPILQDRGLVTGLESLAARSIIPVRLELRLDPDVRLPSEIERSAYFVAAELLTNAAKHSGASDIRLHVALRRGPGRDESWLDVWVIDNGVGGAVLRGGHGLSGLNERVHGLRGVLSLDSPAGGPTTIGAHIPVSGYLTGTIASPSARP